MWTLKTCNSKDVCIWESNLDVLHVLVILNVLSLPFHPNYNIRQRFSYYYIIISVFIFRAIVFLMLFHATYITCPPVNNPEKWLLLWSMSYVSVRTSYEPSHLTTLSTLSPLKTSPAAGAIFWHGASIGLWQWFKMFVQYICNIEISLKEGRIVTLYDNVIC